MEPLPETEVVVRKRCKIEGCPFLANERYTRGSFAGLCVEVHIEEARERARVTGRESAKRRGREKQFRPRDPDVPEKEPLTFVTPTGAAVRRPFDDRRVRRMIEGFNENPEEYEARVMSKPRATRRAPKLSKIEMTIGGKVLRVAEAMARLRGLAWWELHDSKKAAFVALAELAVSAVELVEDDEANFDYAGQEALERRRERWAA